MNNDPLLPQETQQQDYLSTIEDNYFQLVSATTGERFVNFLIDNIFMRFVMGYATGFLLGIILGSISPGLFTDGEDNWLSLFLLGLLVAYVNYVVYYTLCEKLFRGKTLGKLITGTRATRADGSELTFKDSLLRSLSRIVPFEVLSGFGGYPWHDTWTNTIVVKGK